MSGRTLFLGVDGGGTKTAVAVWDRVAGRLGTARGGGSAVVGRPTAPALETLEAVVDAALFSIGAERADVAACAIGLSGIDFAHEHPSQLGAIAGALASISDIALVNDAIVALWGSSPSPAAVILQHGTAITSAYRASFGEERCFDHLDAGLQIDLRRECLVRVARMLDGRVPRTPFCDRVLAHLAVDAHAFHEHAFHALLFVGRPGAPVATLAQVVFRAWEEGDSVATELVETALADYVTTSVAMIRRTESASPHIAFGGGVLETAPPRVRERLEAAVRASSPGAIVGRPRLRPELGAVVMAAHRAGLDPAAAFAELARVVER